MNDFVKAMLNGIKSYVDYMFFIKNDDEFTGAIFWVMDEVSESTNEKVENSYKEHKKEYDAIIENIDKYLELFGVEKTPVAINLVSTIIGARLFEGKELDKPFNYTDYYVILNTTAYKEAFHIYPWVDEKFLKKDKTLLQTAIKKISENL